MPNHSFADVFTDFERLLMAIRVNEGDLPNLVDRRAVLEQVVTEMKVLSARQDAHRAGLRESTARLKELQRLGGNAVREMRFLIRGSLGSRSEKLAEFRIPVVGRPRATPAIPPELKK